MVKRFSEETKQNIVNVVEYLKQHPEICRIQGKSNMCLAADMLKVSGRSLYRLKNSKRPRDAEYKTNLSVEMKRIKTKIHMTLLMSVREVIYKMIAGNEHVTIKSLYDRVKEEILDFSGCPRSLNTLIRKIGFEFSKHNNNPQLLMEHPGIRLKRSKCLRKYVNNKVSSLFTPVFVDKTWCFSKGSMSRKS
ncbi:hypothetical protein ILUMI_14597 [Ignelater luminosus]|uniref:Uncharacterized protein n=1 Tax=Ignelater luminosus TaxID=2038154 RepID=A0A8K0CTX5_IGNLU|nr:hypothetical protein ILUMI_14597 [Ignelater luminosus]